MFGEICTWRVATVTMHSLPQKIIFRTTSIKNKGFVNQHEQSTQGVYYYEFTFHDLETSKNNIFFMLTVRHHVGLVDQQNAQNYDFLFHNSKYRKLNKTMLVMVSNIADRLFCVD